MDGPKEKSIINYNMPYNMENDKGNDSVLIVIYDRGSFHTTQQGAFHKQRCEDFWPPSPSLTSLLDKISLCSIDDICLITPFLVNVRSLWSAPNPNRIESVSWENNVHFTRPLKFTSNMQMQIAKIICFGNENIKATD